MCICLYIWHENCHSQLIVILIHLIHLLIYFYSHTHKHTHKHARTNTQIRTHIHTHTHTHTHTHIYIYIYKQNATWTSIPYGIYLCLNCSGVHRSLGTHASFVRSTNLDKWEWKQLIKMQQGMFYVSCFTFYYVMPCNK